jgi:hypothetical protein
VVRVLLTLGLLAGALALGGQQASAAGPSDEVILVGDFWFCNATYQGGVCPTTIDVGDTVEWDFSPMGQFEIHTATDCGANCGSPTGTPLFDSGLVGPGPGGPNDPYKFTFNTPGTYYYFCEVHPFTMLGEINVGGVGGVSEIDPVAGAPAEASQDEDKQHDLIGAVAGTAVAAAIGLVSLGVYARRRWMR